MRDPNYIPQPTEHSSGQAVVRLNGKDYYLGPWRSAQAKGEYQRLIGEWLTGGRRLPDPAEGQTVNESMLAYLRHAEQHYRKPNGETTRQLELVKLALRPLKEFYGRTLAAEFGPLALKAVRQRIVQQGTMCRLTVNEHVSKIRRMFAWGVENELVPPSVFHGLQAVKRLQAGRTKAKDHSTRPISTWRVYSDPSVFIRRELDHFLKGYNLDLQRSQPNRIEIVAEKLTVQSVIESVAAGDCIPLTIGRGYSSLPPRHAMYQRFMKSRKEKLILLIVADHDPEGFDIPYSFASSVRDDFKIHKDTIVAAKVALTAEQVQELHLPPNRLEAKKNSSRYRKFAGLYGDDVYELEFPQSSELQRLLRQAIDSVLDSCQVPEP